jgi:acyl-CoA dehydrogenase
MLMECLSEGRAISLPALSTSAGKFACRATGAYARVRRQFNMPIGFFEGVEEPLSRMAGRTYVMAAARTLTAVMVDQGEKPSVLSAVVKYNLTEIMRRTVIDAMDIQGGSGICLGPRNLLGRVYQALPISITVEGANILTRSLIIFGQGAVRSHPYVRQEMEAMEDPDSRRAAERLQHTLLKHGRFFFANLGRSFYHGFTRSRFAPAPASAAPETLSYYRRLSRFSAAFALTTDVALLTMGGALKRREHISGRLADVLSQMFLASAALKRFEDQGRPAEDLPLVHWACQDALVQAQEALDGVFRNFPNRPAAWFLRKLIFPTGLHLTPPDDRLGHQAARLLLAPGPARDRLTDGIFLPRDPREALCRLEDALKKVTACVPLEQRLRAIQRELSLEARTENELIDKAEAVGRLSPGEAQALRAARAATLDVIQVDDFPPDFRITPSPTFFAPSPLAGEGRGGG